MQNIDADDEASWPQNLTAGLAALEGAMRAFHAERRRIDKLAEEDVLLRIERPSNPYQNAWDEALALAEQEATGHCLIGYHATRLTLAEQNEIKQFGLRCLSTGLFARRLAALQSEGLMSAAETSLLQARHQVEDSNRANKSWFCFSRSMLSDEWGIARFFRSWGGEALYNSHEDDRTTGAVLRRIGEPCIVAVAVPIEHIETFMSVAERLLNVWTHRRSIGTGHQPDFEGYINVDTPTEKILRVIVFGQPEFVEMTKHNLWKHPLAL